MKSKIMGFFKKIPIFSDGSRCPGCGATRHQKIYDESENFADFRNLRLSYTASDGISGNGRIVRCVTCGLVFVPRESLPDLSLLYGNQQIDNEYVREEKGRRKTARRILKNIRAFSGKSIPNRLLDFGAAAGFFVDEAAKAGWDASGIEMGGSWHGFNKNRRHPLPLEAGGIETLEKHPDNFFGVITAWDVVEHLEDPMSFLRLVSQKLAPAGIFVFSTPRFDSLASRILGKKWHAVLPSHITYFTREAARRNLENAGFTVMDVRSHRRYFSLQYLLNRMFGIRKNGILRTMIIPVNFFDEMELYCLKSR